MTCRRQARPFRLLLHLAEAGDPTDDVTALRPEGRPVIELGHPGVTGISPTSAADEPRLIFDPTSVRARGTQREPHAAGDLRHMPTVFRMLPMCSSMCPSRPSMMSCSAVIGGASVNTVPLFAS